MPSHIKLFNFLLFFFAIFKTDSSLLSALIVVLMPNLPVEYYRVVALVVDIVVVL